MKTVSEIVESFKFSGGEIQVTLKDNLFESGGRVNLKAHLHSSDAIMELLLTADAYKRIGVTVGTLQVPYLPYARQDRVCASGQALSIAVMANLINSIGAEKVVVFDCHSPVGLALINNVHNISKAAWAADIYGLSSRKKYEIIAPDAGAQKSAYEFAKALPNATGVTCAHKYRDVTTGAITGVAYEGDVTGKHCLIVDDICDGGATFTALSKKLREGGAASVELFVVHGIFSRGLEVFDNLEHIWCVNVFDKELEHSARVSVIH